MRLLIFAAFLTAISSTVYAQPPETAPFPPKIPGPSAHEYPGAISLEIDARDTERRIVQISERIPVESGGVVTLLYPEWLPGKHASRGAISQLAGIEFFAGNKKLKWKRDPVNVFAFHVEVPEGANAVDFKAQYLSATDPSQSRVEITPALMNLQWNSFLLYPAGYKAHGIDIDLSLRLPKGWGYASALTPQSGVAGNGAVKYETTDLADLVDSPMFAGAHFKRIMLDDGVAPVHLNIVGDEQNLIEASDEQIQLHKNLVEQADKLFGARHFDRYDFLLALSNTLGGIGLEHHRSSENAPHANYFVTQEDLPRSWGLLPHEYTHSWNGKFRRPADLYTENFDVPMRDSLLWVYEGMTQYWGQVLASRSGIWDRETALEIMAVNAATYDQRIGRVWRPLVDTTNDPIILARRPQGWNSWQRSEDYYTEGLLIWLDADTLIRKLSNDEKSLDDFAQAFFGIEAGRITPLTYDFNDIVETLNSVVEYDWAAFLNTRVYDVAKNPPLDGITRGGYKLVYGDKENVYYGKLELSRKFRSFMYSVGFTLDEENIITGVQWDGSAFNAGLKVSDQLIAINGTAFTADKLKNAILAAENSKQDISLLIKSGDAYRTVLLDYHDGLQIPRLVRIDGVPDRLGAILDAK